MSKSASVFQKKVMSWGYRGKEIFKPLNTGRIDEHVSCVREWIANIFLYTKNGVTYFRMQDPYGNYCVDWTEAYLKTRIYSVNMSDYLTAQVRGIMWLE